MRSVWERESPSASVRNASLQLNTPPTHERLPPHRCEVDLSLVPVNQRQLFSLSLNPGRGVLVFLLAVKTCSGVSVTDLCAAPLDQPHERQHQLENYVSTFRIRLTKRKARAPRAPCGGVRYGPVNQPSSFQIAPLLKGFRSFLPSHLQFRLT